MKPHFSPKADVLQSLVRNYSLPAPKRQKLLLKATSKEFQTIQQLTEYFLLLPPAKLAKRHHQKACLRAMVELDYRRETRVLHVVSQVSFT
jgi:hypothetical protein